MKITKRQLRRLIQEAMGATGASAEFDAESVMFNGQALDQEELASQVSSPSQWMDNFDLMGMYAAQALRDNHGVTTITDYEQPGKSWPVDEFIALKKRIASDYQNCDTSVWSIEVF